LGLPCANTITAEEFMAATLDVWQVPSESARRVGHPAPFPVELPRRLIDLYTYRGDVVLDPFLGSGSTALAAIRTDRHYVGFDTDAEYVALSERRIAAEPPPVQLELARPATDGADPSAAGPADPAPRAARRKGRRGGGRPLRLPSPR
jgi:hypothetical protein